MKQMPEAYSLKIIFILGVKKHAKFYQLYL